MAGLGCPQLLGEVLTWSDGACIWKADAQAYRRLQEVAYVNQEGSSALSLYGLMLYYPMVVSVHHAVATRQEHARRYPAAAVMDAAVSVVPLTLIFAAPQLALAHFALMAAVTALIEVLRRYTAKDMSWGAAASFSVIDPGNRLRFIAEYRAVIMTTTCVAILAVDFASVFPRAHAKTEDFGSSLMDLGTGCIMCASAICSKQARRRPGEVGRRSLGMELLRKLANLWPLLLIGLSRLALLRGIDYHVPTSEYGVHWNFFFTIAVVALVSTALDLGPRAAATAGAATLVAYQISLSMLGGADYILHAPRVDLLSANREGVLSCAGYLSLHWLAVAMGSLFRPGQVASRTVLHLLSVALGSGAGWAILAGAGLHMSRRMCNLPYVLLILSVNAWVLALLAGLDLLAGRPRPPMSLALGGIQDSMFVVFLLANLLTGAVNVSMNSLLVPFWPSLLVLMLYCLGWSVPFALLRTRGVVLKFW